MDIVIIAQFLGNIEGKNNYSSRFVYLAEMLANENKSNKIEIVTSDFIHGLKRHTKSKNSYLWGTMTFCHEKGYKKNICFKRFFSHYELSKNIEDYLISRDLPDVIYVAVPSLDVAYVAAKFCRKHHIRLIVDIQDLWPEAFKMVFNIPIISNFIFYPMKKKADYIYKSANNIVAVSETYAKRGIEVNGKCQVGTTVFLGTDLETFDAQRENLFEKTLIQKDSNNEVFLAYCGTLGHSYDLNAIFEALYILKKRNINYKLIVMGDGPLKDKFKKYSDKLDIPVFYTGMLNYSLMVKQMCVCDIAINPISHGAAQSIINKHADYAAAGLPIISTQENEEFKCLLDNYKMGINCDNCDCYKLADKIEELIKNENLRIEMGKNARKCAEEKFDRKKSYKELVDVITHI